MDVSDVSNDYSVYADRQKRLRTTSLILPVNMYAQRVGGQSWGRVYSRGVYSTVRLSTCRLFFLLYNRPICASLKM
ncbi:hypothetical protein KIN20_004291 [Parelaphostrongylus tenuis]|uniref:Uncharacterized protein n=1 Tax=Parelaphostrongylus tenuis TaxID=148309 RepID=A0AAD5LY79_PARTN|nr:hypothetical protein KIN20_004291 [Parelaphostrongylus tenuis]